MAKPKRSRPTPQPKQLGGIPGFHIFDPKMNAQVVFADWERQSIPTIVHMVPAIDNVDDSGEACKPYTLPFRSSTDAYGMNPYLFRAAVARNFGVNNKGRTFIFCDVQGGQSIEDSPVTVLTRNIMRAVKMANKRELDRVTAGNKKVDPRDWFMLVKNDQTDRMKQVFKSISQTTTTFVPCLPLWAGGKLQLSDTNMLRGAGPGDAAQFLMLSRSADEALVSAIDKRVDENREDPDDVIANYVHGDPTQLGEGKWLVIYNPAHHDISELRAKGKPKIVEDEDEEVEFDPSAEASRGGGKGGGMKSNTYAAEFLDTVRVPRTEGAERTVMSAKRLTTFRDTITNVMQNYGPVYDYFDIADIHEQCIHIASGFADMREVVDYGLRDFPLFQDAEVQAILAAQVQVAAPSVTQDEDEGEEEDEFTGGGSPFGGEEEEEDEDQADPAAGMDSVIERAKKRAAAKRGDGSAPRKKKKKAAPKGDAAATPVRKKKKKTRPADESATKQKAKRRRPPEDEDNIPF